ncbi:hypothetical protein JAAARDRAFT_196922 [Jaapia argillacea MUCL 33604]|uniref:Retrotransposon gag domain-containing protein n=1 Tax=Jaapia argillacea MUCL 33604 TaxID=933084 RepID=A0A067PK13_9AGAM|nr:hypothetical protein JAAARDRAFT_196922 [Jaapia argillacea MUCL 33604]
MPPCEIDTVINFICRIILIFCEGLHLGIAILSHAHGHVEHHLGDLLNEEDFHRPWNTAPTPPPPTAPSVGTPDFTTTPACSPSPPSPRELDFLARLATRDGVRRRTLSLDPLFVLQARINTLNSTLDYPDTRSNTPDYENYETADFNEHLIFWVVCLLEALRSLLLVLGEVRPYLTDDERARIEGPTGDVRNIRETLIEAINRGEWRQDIAEHALEVRYNQFSDEDPLFAPDEDVDGNVILDVLIPIPQPPRFEEVVPEVVDLTEDDDRVVKGSGTKGDPFVLLLNGTDNTFPPNNDNTAKECDSTPCPNRYTYTGTDDYDYSIGGDHGFRPVTPEHIFQELRQYREPTPQIPVESPESPVIPLRVDTPPSPTTPPTQLPPLAVTLVQIPQAPILPIAAPPPLPPIPTPQLPVMAAVQMTDAQFQQLLDTLKGSNSKVERIAAPGHYDGDKKEYDDWHNNVVAYIDANAKAYGTDKAKFLYVTSLLRGAASTWRKHIRTQWTQHEGLLVTEKAKATPDAAEINREEKARIRILETKQGNRTADEYLTDYNRFVLEAKLDLPDAFHIDNLKRNVNTEIIRKIETGITKPPTGFVDYGAGIIWIDEATRQFNAQHCQTQLSAQACPFIPRPQTVFIQRGQPPRQFTPQQYRPPSGPPPSQSGSGQNLQNWRTGMGTTFGGSGQPMDLSCARASAVCYNCQQKGHFA